MREKTEELADQAVSMAEFYKLCVEERSLLTLATTSKKSDSKTIVEAMPDTATKEAAAMIATLEATHEIIHETELYHWKTRKPVMTLVQGQKV